MPLLRHALLSLFCVSISLPAFAAETQDDCSDRLQPVVVVTPTVDLNLKSEFDGRTILFPVSDGIIQATFVDNESQIYVTEFFTFDGTPVRNIKDLPGGLREDRVPAVPNIKSPSEPQAMARYPGYANSKVFKPGDYRAGGASEIIVTTNKKSLPDIIPLTRGTYWAETMPYDSEELSDSAEGVIASPDEKHVIVSIRTETGTLAVIDTETLRVKQILPVRDLKYPGSSIGPMYFSPNGEYLVAPSGMLLFRFDAKEGWLTQLQVPNMNAGSFSTRFTFGKEAIFSPDSGTVAIGKRPSGVIFVRLPQLKPYETRYEIPARGGVKLYLEVTARDALGNESGYEVRDNFTGKLYGKVALTPGVLHLTSNEPAFANFFRNAGPWSLPGTGMTLDFFPQGRTNPRRVYFELTKKGVEIGLPAIQPGWKIGDNIPLERRSDPIFWDRMAYAMDVASTYSPGEDGGNPYLNARHPELTRTGYQLATKEIDLVSEDSDSYVFSYALTYSRVDEFIEIKGWLEVYYKPRGSMQAAWLQYDPTKTSASEDSLLRSGGYTVMYEANEIFKAEAASGLERAVAAELAEPNQEIEKLAAALVRDGYRVERRYLHRAGPGSENHKVFRFQLDFRSPGGLRVSVITGMIDATRRDNGTWGVEVNSVNVDNR